MGNLNRRHIVAVLAVLSGAAGVFIVGSAIGVYLVYPGYLDHGEASLAAQSFAVLSGAPAYPPFEGEVFTGNLYGPIAFAANALAMGILGGSIVTSKAAGMCAALLVIPLTWYSYRGCAGSIRWLSLAAMAALIAVNIPYSIWSRPEPLLLLCAALAVFVVRCDGSRRRPELAAALVGLLGGLAVGVKIFGGIYVAPVGLYLVVRERSWRCLVVMVLCGLASACAPFLLPAFPLDGYLAWFALMAGKPSSRDMFVRALRYGMFVLVPMVLVLTSALMASRDDAKRIDWALVLYAASALLGSAACIYLASKPGAGAYYLLPFAPVVVDLVIRAIGARTQQRSAKWLGGVAVLLVIAAFVTSIPVQKRFYRNMHWAHAQAVINDLRGLIQTYPDARIQMGIGDNVTSYRDTLFKTVLIFAGHPFTVDFGVMMETSKRGLALPRPLIDALGRCDTDIWLIPKGDRPFEMAGYYGNPTVDRVFVETFHGAYDLRSESRFFDVWVCRENGS